MDHYTSSVKLSLAVEIFTLVPTSALFSSIILMCLSKTEKKTITVAQHSLATFLEAIVHVSRTVLMSGVISSAFHAASRVAATASGTTPAADRTTLLVRRGDGLLALGGRRRRIHILRRRLFAQAVQGLTWLLLLLLFLILAAVVVALMQTIILTGQIDDVGVVAVVIVVGLDQVLLQHVAHLRSALLAIVPHQTGRLVVVVVDVAAVHVATHRSVPTSHIAASHRRHPFRATPGGVDVEGSVLATTDDLMRRGRTSSVVHVIINHLVLVDPIQ